MTKSNTRDPAGPQLDLLAHLEAARGWGSDQALAALGEYLMSSEPGRRLGLESRPSGA